MTMLFFLTWLVMSTSLLAIAQPTVYLIRHGEKPESGDGLSMEGLQRAQCLQNVFGKSSSFDIQYIMAQTPQSDGSRQRPYDTVLPLSQDLGLQVDTSCDRDDQDCVADVVDSYKGAGNILICWEHKRLNNIVDALGDSSMSQYPSDSFNLIWTDPFPYDNITSVTSENCPGLDDGSTIEVL